MKITSPIPHGIRSKSSASPGRARTSFSATRRLFCGALAALALVSLAPRAAAISDGILDGESHPYVGLVVAYADAAGTIPIWRGTGTLLSPKIFLTAGHVVGADAASGTTPMSMRVYFESDETAIRAAGFPFAGGHTGAPLPHPAWNGLFTPPNTHDIGVVVLDQPVVMAQYGQLPALGVLDALATKRGQQSVTFDIAGYGLQYIRQNPVKGAIKLEAELTRYQGTVSLVNLGNSLSDGYNLMHTGDNGRGNGSGATNFGDSGGPSLLAGSRVVVGITSFGLNAQGTGPGFAFRTDTAESQTFLNAVFTLYDPANNPFGN